MFFTPSYIIQTDNFKTVFQIPKLSFLMIYYYNYDFNNNDDIDNIYNNDDSLTLLQSLQYLH